MILSFHHIQHDLSENCPRSDYKGFTVVFVRFDWLIFCCHGDGGGVGVDMLLPCCRTGVVG